MSVLKVVLIEDERLASDRLTRLLQQVVEQVEVLQVLETVRESIRYFQTVKHFDLVFCDIHLADGKCFEIFSEIEISQPIIFTTAYNQYSIDAFDYNSIQYLLKPISREELEMAIKKYRTFHRPVDSSVLSQLMRQQQPPRKILLKAGMKMMSRHAEDISLFYVKNKIVFAQEIASQKSYVTDYRVEDLVKYLAQQEDWFRVNRGCLVNRTAIDAIIPFEGQRYLVNLKTQHNFDIIVSRDKVKAFKQWYIG